MANKKKNMAEQPEAEKSEAEQPEAEKSEKTQVLKKMLKFKKG